MLFKEYYIEKTRLTDNQIKQVQKLVKDMSEAGKMSSEIISQLQKQFPYKLGDRWRAERAFWTEKKRIDSRDIKDKASDLDFEKFRILPNTGACIKCRSFSQNGKKIFARAEMYKNGRAVPPIHPSCLCLVLPVIE